MDLKARLIEILKEASVLADSDTKTIPKTKIRVRSDRVDEFTSLAYLYYIEYKKENNIIELEDSKTNYLSFVYDVLKSEVEENLGEDISVKNEDLIANAYSLIENVRTNSESFERVYRNLQDFNSKYETLVAQAENLKTRVTSMDYSIWKNRFDEINASIAEYAENIGYATKYIIKLKNEMNASFVQEIDKEMARMREEFTKHPKLDNPAFGKDGNSILPGDQEAYDSLIELKDILGEVKDIYPIIGVGKVVCVNASQEEKVKALLTKVNNFKYLVIPSENKNVNAELIANIKKEMASMAVSKKIAKQTYKDMPNGVIVLDADEERYLNLIEILKVLNRANASNGKLENVWGVANVLHSDKDLIRELMRKEDTLKDKDPDKSKKEENEKLIKEFEDYLESIEKSYIEYKSYTNIPSRLTSRDTVVLDDDYDEYEAIAQMIIYLKMNNNEHNKRYDLVDVWGLGYVSNNEKEIAEYKKLISSTKKYGNKAPKIEENEKIIEAIKKELIALNERAKNTPNPILADNKMVLLEDEEEYNLLISKLKYLEASKGSINLEEIKDGAKIDHDYAGYYRNINDKLENIRASKTPNKLKLREIENELRALDVNDPNNKEKIEILKTLKSILENAEKSTKLVDIDGIKVDSEDEKAYKELTEKLKNLGNPPIEKTPNEIKEAEITSELAKLQKEDMTKEENIAKEKALKSMKDILDRAKTATELEEVDGIKIAKDDVPEYKNAKKVLADLAKPKPLPPEKKTFKVEVRKLKDNVVDWFKTHKKTFVAIGLTTLALGLGAYFLIEPIIYACSYIAANSSMLAPAMGFITNSLCNMGFATMSNGAILNASGQLLSGNFMVSRTLAHLVGALAGAGIIGLDVHFVKKFLRNENEERLPDLNPNKKKKLSNKIAGLIDKIKGLGKGKSLEEELEDLDEEDIDLTVNDEKIEQIEKMLIDLDKNNPGVDSAELEQLKSNLETMKSILKYSYTSKNKLEEVEGVWVDSSLKASYLRLNEGLKNIILNYSEKGKSKGSEGSLDPELANKELKSQIEDMIADIDKNDSRMPEENQLKAKLQMVLQLLDNAKNAKRLAEMEDGILIDENAVDAFNDLDEEISDLLDKIEEKKKSADRIAAEISDNVGKALGDTQDNVQRRVAEIGSEPEVANILGQGDPVPAAPAPNVDPEQVIKTLEGQEGSIIPEDGDLFNDVARFVVKSGKVSISDIIGKFKIGYAKSAHIVDLLAVVGIVQPDGLGGYKVSVNEEDLEKILASRAKYNVVSQDEQNVLTDEEKLNLHDNYDSLTAIEKQHLLSNTMTKEEYRTVMERIEAEKLNSKNKEELEEKIMRLTSQTFELLDINFYVLRDKIEEQIKQGKSIEEIEEDINKQIADKQRPAEPTPMEPVPAPGFESSRKMTQEEIEKMLGGASFIEDKTEGLNAEELKLINKLEGDIKKYQGMIDAGGLSEAEIKEYEQKRDETANVLALLRNEKGRGF